MQYPLEMFALSDAGCVREKNEDALYIDPSLGLAILADGMGGHRSGEVASQLAVATIAEIARDAGQAENVQDLLEQSLKSANRAVYESSRMNVDHFGMGTTVISSIIRDNTAHIAHVGDSRVYLHRNADLTQITEDHTYRTQIARYASVSNGLDEGSEADEIGDMGALGKMLVRAIGIEPEVEIDTCTIGLENGDYLLLCSDGLTDVLSDAGIARILNSEMVAEAAAEKLVQQAIQKGGPDNISVIVIRL